MLRNSTNTLKVFAFNHNTAHPQTGDAANITCKVSLDGAAAVTLADTNPTEMEDGYYLFNVTAAESNGVTADFFPESSTSNVQVICCEHNRYLLPQGGVATLNNQGTIISALSAGSITVVSPVSKDFTVTLFEGMTYNGIAHERLTFTTIKNYGSASSIVLSIHLPTDYTDAVLTAAATAPTTTTVQVTSLTASFSPALTYSGNPSVAELRYSLIATYASGLEVIATGPCFVYQTPPVV